MFHLTSSIKINWFSCSLKLFFVVVLLLLLLQFSLFLSLFLTSFDEMFSNRLTIWLTSFVKESASSSVVISVVMTISSCFPSSSYFFSSYTTFAVWWRTIMIKSGGWYSCSFSCYIQITSTAMTGNNSLGKQHDRYLFLVRLL